MIFLTFSNPNVLPGPSNQNTKQICFIWKKFNYLDKDLILKYIFYFVQFIQPIQLSFWKETLGSCLLGHGEHTRR
jgi:hypothetical protein